MAKDYGGLIGDLEEALEKATEAVVEALRNTRDLNRTPDDRRKWADIRDKRYATLKSLRDMVDGLKKKSDELGLTAEVPDDPHQRVRPGLKRRPRR